MTEKDPNPDLFNVVEKENELKRWLVNYVGEKIQPENDEVTVEMIIDVLSAEFPEALLAVAEENFIRGYQQAMYDIENLDVTEAQKVVKEKIKS